jgi:acyl carrier protein
MEKEHIVENKISFDRFKAMIADHFGLETEKISREVSFISDLGLDSLSLVNFIVKLEKKYGIRIEMESVWSMKNIGEAYDLFTGQVDPDRSGVSIDKSSFAGENKGAKE